MKKIKLTQGKVALVDDADYDWLSQWKWCVTKQYSGYYAVRNSPLINGKRPMISMHRQILGLERGDKRQGDHQNHNTLDNCRDNLRICTNQQNSFNQKVLLNASSPFKGICWHKMAKKWMAQIMINRKFKYLGIYKSEKDAARAYNQAAKKYHGEFACLNLI